jgi:hypothetical protein
MQYCFIISSIFGRPVAPLVHYWQRHGCDVFMPLPVVKRPQNGRLSNAFQVLKDTFDYGI